MLESNANNRKMNPKSIVFLFMVILAIASIILLQTKDDYRNLSGKPMLGKAWPHRILHFRI